MCGRFVQVSSPELLVDQFGVDEAPDPPLPGSYNVAPRDTVYVVRDRIIRGGDQSERSERRELAEERAPAGRVSRPAASDDQRRRYLSELRWGLVPAWAKEPKIGDRMINARAETVTEAPAYKRAFERHRCLVPADGFYEWGPPVRGKRKQPMFVHRKDGQPFAFAGLWSAWRDPATPDAEWLRTCVIITTDANAEVAPIHDRMPVVLDARNWDEWLDPANSELDELHRLLVPAPDHLLVAYPVSPLVNKADNDGPELVERVDPESDSGGIPSLL